MISKRMAAGVLLLIGLCVLAAPGAAWTNGSSETAIDSEQILNVSSSEENGSPQDIVITLDKQNIIRNHAFVVTLAGDPNTDYYLYIRDASAAANRYPIMKSGQPSVAIVDSALTGAVDSAADTLANSERARVGGAYVPCTAAAVTTGADGTGSVGFDTNTSTAPLDYVIKVVDQSDASKCDEETVSVEKGAVAITPEGPGTYYLGQKIELSGINTEGDYVYLFITGPTLGDGDGVSLENTTLSVKRATTSAATGFVTEDVGPDDTWEYTWNTGDIDGKALSEGSYTIYAVSNYLNDDKEPVYKGNLGDVAYATAPVRLRKGFITDTTNVQTLAKGDDLKITGIAEGDPDDIYVWIFGKNFFGKNNKVQDSESVDDDGTFEYKLDDTEGLASGQYFVILQHPMTMTGAGYDVLWDSTKDVLDAPGIASTVNLLNLQPSDAATVVINAIDSANVDDTYTKLTFMVEEPKIDIDTIGDKSIGSRFTITGSTNLAVGDELYFDVIRASSNATHINDTEFEASGSTAVRAGTGHNIWSFAINTTGFNAEPYIVRVEGMNGNVSQNTTFSLTNGTPGRADGAITLSPGWNFVSTPKTLADGNDTATIFAGVDTAGHSILSYDAASQAWNVLKTDDAIEPLEGYWIYAAEKTNIPLSYAAGSPQAPPARTLTTGWNAIGFSDTEPAATRDTLLSLGDAWSVLMGFDATSQAYETSIIRGGSGEHSDTGSMMPMKGYWLYMNNAGTLAAIGA